MKKINLIVVILILMTVTNSVLATQTVKLNTGYNHSLIVDAPYSSLPTQDNYWIKVWSTWSVVQAPSWAVPIGTSPWFPSPLPNSNWINVQNNNGSTYPTSISSSSYHLYRKCFCLQQGFNQASMNLDFRADDGVAVWFNSSWLFGFSAGNWAAATPYTIPNVTTGFKVGRNCVYVLIGDIGTYTGFNLTGNVTANGLLPTPAFGTAGTFQPCGCGGGPVSGGQTIKTGDNDDDTKVIEEIVKSVRRNQKTNTDIMRRAIEVPRISDTKN